MPPTASKSPAAVPDAPTLRQRLLDKLPPALADSYSEEQIEGIRILLGDRTWGKHSIDSRGSFAIPFFRWRFYWVFLFGRNRRAYSRTERHLSLVMMLAMGAGFILLCLLLGLFGLYLLKSWLGIDLLPGSSLGLWDWVNS
ncbi:hypothetical protein KJI95_02215 [Shewanella sp. JM162201]|uniref:3-phosphoshikimate 1-carboxyvinyltransferase n=1 Tax=Shewanella jiangmenensis TaxID=2837387 RepID=A0ABS5V171_9GAMM|nr:hypothetical protein [Shewanella jiangmenensis]MBT1443344.1 hypothetical protein [Shewanella jiangmenensis]